MANFTCTNCLVSKPIFDFYRNKNKHGHNTQCKTCIKNKYTNIPKPTHTKFICKKCKIEKLVIEFYPTISTKYGHSRICKQCQSRRTTTKKTPDEINLSFKKRQKERKESKIDYITYYKTKKKFISIFGGKCSICEYKGCLGALEFHHLNPKEKDFNINRKNLSHTQKKWKNCISEASKCILVCCRCHRELHCKSNELFYEKILNEAKNEEKLQKEKQNQDTTGKTGQIL